MFCKLKKLLCLALSLSVISLITVKNLYAQNVTLALDEQPQISDDEQSSDFLGVDDSIPDELALPDELPAPGSLPPQNTDGNFDENGLPKDDAGTLDLDTPQPVPDSLPAIGPNAPQTGPNANIPLTGPNANLPPIGPNAPQTDSNANLPLIGPNASQVNSDNSLPLIGSNASQVNSDNSLPLIGSNAPTGHEESVSEAIATLNTPDVENLGEGLLDKIDNKLFAQMSDLEKQTALLTLELRREKIKNEIAAIKAQRQKAIEEEEAKKEEKERKRIEWEKEQEAKILREKQAVLAAEAKLERLRQEKVLRAYKEVMLKEKQEWIKNNAKLYEQIKNVETDRKNLLEGLKNKMTHISALATKAQQDAETAKENYQREVKNLQTQISILKSRLEAEIAERKNEKANPFAQTEIAVTEEEELPRLAEEYAIMEIRGKGDKLTAKLINKGGDSFMVRKGTVLQTGHEIDEITQTYIRAEINGIKDYLYFAAGGILEKEPEKSDIQSKNTDADGKKKDPAENLRNTTMVNQGVPSLGSGMFVR